MKDRHARVERICEWCGNSFMARVERVNVGQGRFCSRACANEYQRDQGKITHGFENGKKYWDGNHWMIRWYDDKGNAKTTSYARWWWIINIGKISNDVVVSYIDGNYENISPDNFILKSKTDLNRENGSKSDTTSYGFLGHTHTKATRQKMSERQIGRRLSESHRKNIGKATKERWNSGMYDNIKFIDISGDKNPGWRGGAGTEYPEEFNKSLKRIIYDRDNYTCQICGDRVGRGGKVGHVHHIDGHKENLDHDNLILLCIYCHGKIHKSKDVSSPVIMAFRSKLYWNQ